MDGAVTSQGPDRGVSRRKFLKRAGIAGGLLWASPVFTSAAHAMGGPHCRSNGDNRCGPDECADQTLCSGLAEGQFCTCLTRTNGAGAGCFCHEPQSCAGLTACTNPSDCPPGWACADSCCGPGFCLPPCGTNTAFAGVHALVASGVKSSVG
jgi:hypothetical protein